MFRDGKEDPRSHPFALMIFPKEFLQGSWVEPWRSISFQDPFPEGLGSF